jgi:large subunit ribosomal protein L17
MRHGKALRKLGRTTAHRMSLLRNLSTSFFDKERISTTLPKAKELRPFAEKLITLARRGDLHARRLVERRIRDKDVSSKLFKEIGQRFAARPGGYTRIIRLGHRVGDGAETARIELLKE